MTPFERLATVTVAAARAWTTGLAFEARRSKRTAALGQMFIPCETRGIEALMGIVLAPGGGNCSTLSTTVFCACTLFPSR
jgi:hypothetical protein